MRIGNGLYRWNHYDAELLLWHGRERCGFVIKDDGSTAGYALIELNNVAADPKAFFEMGGDQVRDVYARFNVLGIWHSHPPGTPQPSKTDREWHPVSVDMYIICDLAIRRFTPMTNSLEYQEVPVPWLTSRV